MIDTGFLAIAAGWGVALIALSYALSERRERKWAQDSSDRQASTIKAMNARFERIAAQETKFGNATVRRIIKIARGEA